MVQGAVPKTSAAFADFQLHAQLHDLFSPRQQLPADIVLILVCAGAKGNRRGCSGFLCPDGGDPAVFPWSLSCCHRADLEILTQVAVDASAGRLGAERKLVTWC